MRPASRNLLAAAGILGAGLVAYLLLSQPGESDNNRILGQIEAIRAAVAVKSTAGVMREVSETYHDRFVSNPDQLKFLLSRHILRGPEAVDISIDATSVAITGETATSVSHVRATHGTAVVFDSSITAQWRREPTHRLLVIPDHTWRVTSAEYPTSPDMDL